MKARELTWERLNNEYLNWALKYGEERNEDDLRFGQYLDSKYDMDKQWSDSIFYLEDYEKVYSELLNKLYEVTEK